MLDTNVMTKNKNNHSNALFEFVVVFGATGTIGDALCKMAVAKGCRKLIRFYRDKNKLSSMTRLRELASFKEVLIDDREFGFESDTDVSYLLDDIDQKIDLVIIATGWLHESGFKPEKSITQLDPAHLHKSWLINFLGPSLILKSIYKSQRKHKETMIIATLSARLGSVSDNRYGGWHSYRASKAALNMMIKNFSIETRRQRLPWISVAVQPGTTDSPLSKPFSQNLKSTVLQTPEFTAQAIWSQLERLELEQHNGQFIDFEGNIIDP